MASNSERFTNLVKSIDDGDLNETQNWGGAGLVVGGLDEPESSRHKVIRAQSPGQMSWIINELCDIAALYPNFGVWKIEFFGQLANRLAPMVGKSETDQYLAVVHEAFVFLNYLEQNNSVPVLPVAMNSDVVDDFTGEAAKRAKLTPTEVRADLNHFFNN